MFSCVMQWLITRDLAARSAKLAMYVPIRRSLKRP